MNKSIKILCIDKDKEIHNILSKIVKKKDYSFYSLYSSEEILNKVNTIQPDIILLEIYLDDIDGYTLCKKIKENKITNQIPIIFLSSSNTTFDIMKAFKVGGVDYVSKPFHPAEVIARIETHVRLKRLEQEITEQKRFLNNIFESVQEPLYVINTTDFTVVKANSACGFGELKRDSHCYKLTHHLNTHNSVKQCVLEKIKKEKKPVIIEHIHYKKNGEVRNVEIHGFPIFDDKGKVKYIVEYVVDITKRKKIEIELKKAKDLAIIANQAKTSFLANISHELRTPMTAILGISKMLCNKDADITETDIIEGLNIIHKSGERLLKLINELLDISKIESGQMRIKISPFPLSDLITTVESMIKVLTRKKGIKFSIIKDKLCPDVIISDKDKLSQILLNLLGNSVKFTEKGKIILKIFPKNERIYFIIQDTGIGINNKYIKLIFEEFTQIDSGNSRKYNGTGLGLSLSKKLIELLGGEIEVESEPNIGTTVRFYIPP